ncbi:hypothetical protein CRV00_09960 [Malaciobacter molluscorum]|uniref:hypothetical protein n=1 Tax=Malaciobacter molluscorum TaxID=1032072 RepID=UPI00100BBCB2|nr:hypothetical protein [Malaciobacter molluscorum]RXJ93777.1 hypothetical protein CRV00_09960 [Malaciobacter molluscorum]
MRKRRVEKLEENISKSADSNLVVLGEGLDKPFIYNDKEYNSKEQLEKEYPSMEFDYITIVWEDGSIPLEKQTDRRVIETLEEFEANY